MLMVAHLCILQRAAPLTIQATDRQTVASIIHVSCAVPDAGPVVAVGERIQTAKASWRECRRDAAQIVWLDAASSTAASKNLLECYATVGREVCACCTSARRSTSLWQCGRGRNGWQRRRWGRRAWREYVAREAAATAVT